MLFKDIVEGKTYKADGLEGTYKKVDGLLYNIEEQDFSGILPIIIAVMDFYEYIAEERIPILHVRGCTYGTGEGMGDYELYDKMFQISEEDIESLTSVEDEMETFYLICKMMCREDEDFKYSRMFEDVEYGDWQYKTIDKELMHGDEFKMLLRMTAYNSIMCEFVIENIKTEEFFEREDIYIEANSRIPV